MNEQVPSRAVASTRWAEQVAGVRNKKRKYDRETSGADAIWGSWSDIKKIFIRISKKLTVKK